MPKTRRAPKKISPDSSSDEEPLSKKIDKKKTKKRNRSSDGSSSESDIENYLHPIDKLDLDSEFFNTQKKDEVPAFDQIESNIFAGVSRLSDSDSEDEAEKQEESNTAKDEAAAEEVSHVSKLNFQQLHDFTKKYEEAKRSVEQYEAKKLSTVNNLDISNLLALGEGIANNGISEDAALADLHSSDFESCSDSEKDGWEEVKNHEEKTQAEKDLIPKANLEIAIEMPGNMRKKRKADDFVAAMKRRLNRIKKENQVLVHKVHLLCWIAHGNYVSSVINSEKILALSLSLLPSNNCYPEGRADLKYLEQILKWYKNTIKNVEKPAPDLNLTLDNLLTLQIKKRETFEKRMLVYIFVAILRSIGLQCRLVLSFQLEPVRPPNSELLSLSTKPEDKKGDKSKKSVSSTPSTSKIEVKREHSKPSTKATSHKKVEGPKSSVDSGKSKKKLDSVKEESQKAEKKASSVANKPVKKTESRETKIAQSKSNTKSETAKKPLSKCVTGKAKNEESGLKVTQKARAKSSSENTQNASDKRKGKEIEVRVTQKARSKSSSDNNPKSDKQPAKTSSKSETKQSTSNTEIRDHKRTLRSASKEPQDVPASKQTSAKPGSKRSLRSASKEPREVVPQVDGQFDDISSKFDLQRSSWSSESSSEVSWEFPLESSTELSSELESYSESSLSDLDDDVFVLQADGGGDCVVSQKPNLKKLKEPKAGSSGTTQKSGDNKGSKPNLKKLKEKTEEKKGAGSRKADDKKNAKPNLKKLNEVKKDSCPAKSHHSNDKRLRPSTQKKYADTDSEDDDFTPESSPAKNGVAKKSGEGRVSSKGADDASKFFGSSKRVVEKKNPLDIRGDIVNLVKGRIKEQEYEERRRRRRTTANKRKSYAEKDADSDSDCAPVAVKKKKHESGDEFVPKTVVKQRVQPRSRKVLSSDSENDEKKKKKKKGVDVWVEVFLEAEEKWISVDVVQGQVHCVNELYARASHPVSYIVAWNNDNSIKDITRRYCQNFNTITRKLRIEAVWWEKSIRPFMGKKTIRDKEEDDELEREQLEKPLPKSIAEYKNHPLYALKRHLLKFEGIYPPDPPTLGFIRGEAVYSRQCIYTLHSRDIWLKQAKTVKPGEKPYKIVKARPKYDKLSNTVITDQLLEIFGPWQTEEYVPPTAENGVVPRNAFGNVELFKKCMLPKKTVHLQLPGLNKVARRMNIDCASAIVGFDFHGGWSHPTYDGFVVCEEFADVLIAAWELEQEEQEKRELEKVEKRVYGNWKKLIRGLLIRERLKVKYGFGAASGSKDKKKAKGPRLVTKKRRICSDSDSDSDKR